MSTQQAEEFSDDLIGVNSYSPEPPKTKQFLPWHKPRKHFVRSKQWCGEIRDLVDKIQPEDGMLRYLGLPGDDLLDLRCFHHTICVPQQLKLKFLGFNYSANSKSNSTELNISLAEIKSLPHIDSTSEVLGDNFCRIANTNSMAFKESFKRGPYDIVNLDLCDGFSQIDPNEVRETYYEAINQLLGIQARRPKPWLFLLTTRTGDNHISVEAFERLKYIYLKNLENCSDFLEASTTNFAVSNLETLTEVAQNSKGLSNIFLTALCKWMSGVTLDQRPPSIIKIKSVIGYKVEPQADHQDIVSIAITITPTYNAQKDRVGLANPIVSPPDECSIAIQALNRVAKMIDADQKLASTEQLMEQMISESSSLLEEARYETDTYPAWARLD